MIKIIIKKLITLLITNAYIKIFTPISFANKIINRIEIILFKISNFPAKLKSYFEKNKLI